MIRNSVYLEGNGTSNPIRVDPNETHANILAKVRFNGGATGTVTVEFTCDKPSVFGREVGDPAGTVIGGPTDNFANAQWEAITDLTAITANDSVTIDAPIEALRFILTGFASGGAGSNIELKAVEGYRT